MQFISVIPQPVVPFCHYLHKVIRNHPLAFYTRLIATLLELEMGRVRLIQLEPEKAIRQFHHLPLLIFDQAIMHHVTRFYLIP